MSFLRGMEGVKLFDKVRSSEIRKSLNIESRLKDASLDGLVM